MRPPATDPGPPPDESSLRQAALTHLARYSTTQVGLLAVLTRRIKRWAIRAGAAAEEVSGCITTARAVVISLASVGAVDDAAFAAGRARALHRAGRSRRAVAAHLQMKGVTPELATLPDDPAADFDAALLYVRRRRMGPFRGKTDPAERRRELARLARAGFSADIANRILRLPPEEAETLLLQARLA